MHNLNTVLRHSPVRLSPESVILAHITPDVPAKFVPVVPALSRRLRVAYLQSVIAELREMDCFAALYAIGGIESIRLIESMRRDGVDSGVTADLLALKAGLV